MLHRISFRAVHGIFGALCAATVACSNGSEGPTAPGPVPPDDVPGLPLPPAEPPPADDNPGPPQPIDNVIWGTYMLVRINDADPGQAVLLANPDGSAIGLYRFHERTTLGLTEDQDWTLALHFEDQGTAHDIEDEGRFKRSGQDLRELSFQSAIFGDLFEGRAQDGVAAIKYDIDGDGQPDTIFTFVRILGPGT
ncbi:MAG TPA: hypothetical protein VG500_14075 [Gemmatimonadales bacterium]|jgi:hypothetical protein|nr:hypothetical protein [Gemmatimonadales bacterium]